MLSWPEFHAHKKNKGWKIFNLKHKP
jgi:hypothetical protein